MVCLIKWSTQKIKRYINQGILTHITIELYNTISDKFKERQVTREPSNICNTLVFFSENENKEYLVTPTQ